MGAYAAAKERFANDVVCWNGYAETLRELGRPEEALDAYAEAKDASRPCVLLHKLCGNVARVGTPRRGIGCLRRGQRALRQRCGLLHRLCGNVARLGIPRRGIGCLCRGQRALCQRVVCWNGYAETLREFGRPEEALDAYAEAKERFANDAVCWNGYAETLRELGQLDPAVAAYRAIVSRYPHDGELHNALACLSVGTRRISGSREAIDCGTTVYLVQNWRDFHVLAMAKLAQGLYEQARAMLERGMAQTPFARQRRVFQTSMAVLALQRKQPHIAEENLDVSNAQIIQFPLRAVLRAHAVAAQYRTDEAHGLLEQVKGYKSYGEVIELADVLARRYGLGRVQETTPELDFEIERRELALALRAA